MTNTTTCIGEVRANACEHRSQMLALRVLLYKFLQLTLDRVVFLIIHDRFSEHVVGVTSVSQEAIELYDTIH
jgi:hypothetical protein